MSGRKHCAPIDTGSMRDTLRAALTRCAVPHFRLRDLRASIPESVRVTAGEGLSSSTVNVCWGLFYLVVGDLLVCRVGSFDLRKTQHVLVLGAGILIMSVLLARGFGRFHGGL